MRYFLVRDGIIENTILWDGETPYDPGPNVELILEADLPDLKVGDAVPKTEDETDPVDESLGAEDETPDA